MCGRELIVEILNLYYGHTGSLKYSESEHEIRFQLPAPIRDKQTAVFRSLSKALDELAISHRLSLLIGRAQYSVPEESAFAIKSIETAAHGIDVVDGYNVSLRFEIMATRRDAITALRSTLVTQYGVEARTTITSFDIIPSSLANFVRRARNFLNYADVKMARDKSYFSRLAGNHFRYYPSEDDRLTDGRRVDHMPALTLIDIALFVNGMAHRATTNANISANFLNYTDPRLELDIVQKKDRGAIEFAQNGQLVAIVNNPDSSRFLGEVKIKFTTHSFERGE